MLRTVFMGSDPIALPLLDALAVAHAGDIELVGIYTQPDRPSGRGMKLQANEIKQWALEHSLPIRQPEKLGQEDVDWLQEQRCDLLLVMAYGHILRQKLLDVPRLPPLNFHASLRPAAGASPIETAIATGETRTGVTLMRIVRELDAGPMLDREVVEIAPEDDRASVYSNWPGCVPLFAAHCRTCSR
jgi:methionyl-tRNA formyltransferase